MEPRHGAGGVSGLFSLSVNMQWGDVNNDGGKGGAGSSGIDVFDNQLTSTALSREGRETEQPVFD